MHNLMPELKFHVAILAVLAVVWSAAGFAQDPVATCLPPLDPELARAVLAAAADDDDCDALPASMPPVLADLGAQR